jgi:hypothetical protein
VDAGSVPEFRCGDMHSLLSEWLASESYTRVAREKKYLGLRALHCGHRPWGWPLTPWEHVEHDGKFHNQGYIARDVTGAVKIGISTRPHLRMRELGGGAQLLALLDRCELHHEHALHLLIEPDRIAGEWFQGDLTESLVRFLLSAAQKASAA